MIGRCSGLCSLPAGCGWLVHWCCLLVLVLLHDRHAADADALERGAHSHAPADALHGLPDGVHLLLPAAGAAGCGRVLLLPWLLPQLLPAAYSLCGLELLLLLLSLCCLQYVQLVCMGGWQACSAGGCSRRARWDEPGWPEG